MRRSRARLHQFLLVACVAGLSACSSDDDPNDPGNGDDLSAIVGTWTLQTVDGNALPVELVEDGENFILHSGRIVAASNNTCTNSFTVTPEGEPQETETVNCTFTLSGSLFSLTEEGVTYSGTLNGNTLSITNDGYLLAYTR